MEVIVFGLIMFLCFGTFVSVFVLFPLIIFADLFDVGGSSKPAELPGDSQEDVDPWYSDVFEKDL